jgi:hypothetical protein
MPMMPMPMQLAFPASGMVTTQQQQDVQQHHCLLQQFMHEVNHNQNHLMMFPGHGNSPYPLNSLSFQPPLTHERIDLEPIPMAEPSRTPQQHPPYPAMRIHHLPSQMPEPDPLMQRRQDLTHQQQSVLHPYHGNQPYPQHIQSRVYQQQFQPQQLDHPGFMFGGPMNQPAPTGMGHLGMEEDIYGDYQHFRADELGDYDPSGMND